ncbi:MULTISPECIES: hypothetical protein [unclassified Curtobacterium]|nr:MULTISPECIES: hypothetical protein [unclassified Curtobacterium]WIE55738.1 hypothetical protein DEI88_005925 [Curtobacterium sp. MCBD17_003]
MNGIDGISDAHRGTWSRLTRLHTASAGLPTQTKRTEDGRTARDEAALGL